MALASTARRGEEREDTPFITRGHWPLGLSCVLSAPPWPVQSSRQVEDCLLSGLAPWPGPIVKVFLEKELSKVRSSF